MHITAFELFALVLTHFVTDWLLQWYYTAMNKSKEAFIRALHSIGYSLVFSFVLDALGRIGLWETLAVLLLGVSHYFIDTYKPVYWICRNWQGDPYCRDWETFVKSWAQPRQFAMYVVLDQLLHFLVLFVVVVVCWW